MDNNTKVTDLWNPAVPPTVDALLEIYRILISEARQISIERVKVNTFFLTINTASVTALGAYYGKVEASGEWIPFLVACCALSAFTFPWLRSIYAYDRINTAKFRVIGELETKLPAKALWWAEWNEILCKKKHKPLFNTSLITPFLFLATYMVCIAITASRL